jgi:hypothetical protein
MPTDDSTIDTALNNLRQVLADMSLLVAIAADLRRNTDRLLVPLASELRRVRDAINTSLDVLPNR